MKKPEELNEMSFSELKALRDLCSEQLIQYKNLLRYTGNDADKRTQILEQIDAWKYKEALVEERIGHKIGVYFNEK